jgi:hypothetical protein
VFRLNTMDTVFVSCYYDGGGAAKELLEVRRKVVCEHVEREIRAHLKLSPRLS